MTRTRPAAGAWSTLAVVAAGLFLAVLSTTLVSVALPTIGRDLDASSTDLQWIVDAYVLVYASLLVVGAVLGDRRGRKGVFLLGVTTFALGALVTGLASSVGPLLAGRVVQGVGAALLVPGSLAIVRATFDNPRERAAAIGLWSTSSGLALAVGPVLGGVVVDTAGWRWAFLLNVPLSAGLLLLAAFVVPRIAPSHRDARVDWLGALLATVGLAALTFAIIEGQERGWASADVWAAFVGGMAALVAFMQWEGRLADPLIDVSLFRHPAFAAANVVAFAVFFAFVGGLVYFSAYFQQVEGHSPLTAGLDVSAIGGGLALAAALAGRVIGHVGERGPMLGGLILSGTAMLGLLRLDVHTEIGAIWWNFALLGAGIGLCATAINTIAMSAVDASRAGMASAVVNASRQVGQVFGVAVLGALVYAQLPAESGGQRLDQSDRSLFVGGLHNALWVSGSALLMAAMLAALLLPSNRLSRSPAQRT